MWIASRYKLDRRRRSLSGWLLAAVLVVVGSAAIALAVVLHKPSQIPVAVTKNVHFTVYAPSGAWRVKPGSAAYSSQSGVLTITTTNGATQLIVAEQATPQQFSDIPQYYQALLEKMNQYSSFSSKNGQVYLTKPQELNEGITAVLQDGGSLLFVRPAGDANQATLQSFFDSLHSN